MCVCACVCVSVYVGVHMRADKLKLVYCWIPKVACTSWKMWLRQFHNDPNAKDLMSTHRAASNNITEASIMTDEK